MKTLQPRYTASYFVKKNQSDALKNSSFTGTKRAIITRLKRLSTKSFTDGLIIYDEAGIVVWGISPDGGFTDSAFTEEEWFEITGIREEDVVETKELCVEKSKPSVVSPIFLENGVSLIERVIRPKNSKKARRKEWVRAEGLLIGAMSIANARHVRLQKNPVPIDQ